MSGSVRQSELFAGNDWKIVYQAFQNINFSVADPVTINEAMRNYIATAYPEDFNDWIESSELVAIIDLLAWLAGNLSFRYDITNRDNMLEVAENRDSILRIARTLSYYPKRNNAASGFLKILSVQTFDDVLDAYGNNLNGQIINWNDSQNEEWFENFIEILNNSFYATGPFGAFSDVGTINGIKNYGYFIETNNIIPGSINFSAAPNNSDNLKFEIYPTSILSDVGYSEIMPENYSKLNVIYKNDGLGNNSKNTGFFLPFKQGIIGSQTFAVSTPIENLIIDINVSGINETDVWVQTIDDAGNILSVWDKVPAIFTDNLTFNSISYTNRKIFQVITRDNDQISIKFGDGKFSDIPVGNIRVWFRRSSGTFYTIKPSDMDRVSINIPYRNSLGTPKVLNLTCSLMEQVTNATARETEEEIKARAPLTYSAQGRMVSGEDYNSFPLSTNLAKKIKALNRVYSGQSYYVDLNDPTANYRDIIINGDDGSIYFQEYNTSFNFSSSLLTLKASILENIQENITKEQIVTYIKDELFNLKLSPSLNLYWIRETKNTGRFSSTINEPYNFVPVGYYSPNAYNQFYLNKNSLVKINDTWLKVLELDGTGTSIDINNNGSVKLHKDLPTGSLLQQILPPINLNIYTTLSEEIVSFIENNISFELYYSWDLGKVISRINNIAIAIPNNALLICQANFLASNWLINYFGKKYIFESDFQVRWYSDKGKRTYDATTGKYVRDNVDVLACTKYNFFFEEWEANKSYVLKDKVKYNDEYYECVFNHVSSTTFNVYEIIGSNVTSLWKNIGNYTLKQNYNIPIYGNYIYEDGYYEPRRVELSYNDYDLDGEIDNLDIYSELFDANKNYSLVFHETYIENSYEYKRPIYNIIFCETLSGANIFIGSPKGETIENNTLFFIDDTKTFYYKDNDILVLSERNDLTYSKGRGTSSPKIIVFDNGEYKEQSNTNISFTWKHYADSDVRCDPAIQNIIDVFVLTAQYDYLMRNWINNGTIDEEPEPPSELELNTIFSSLENFKMFTDEIIWRPVKYKKLFGTNAENNLSARFKVVKMQTSTMSDGEVKAKIINAINEFFDISRWDFGETFYFQELSAYVMLQLATHVSSFVIVPNSYNGKFGDLYELSCNPNEVFISTATVNDIDIVAANTKEILRK